MSPNDHRACGGSVGNTLIPLCKPKRSALFHTEALILPSIYIYICPSWDLQVLGLEVLLLSKLKRKLHELAGTIIVKMLET